jgi:hypothetical protein
MFHFVFSSVEFDRKKTHLNVNVCVLFIGSVESGHKEHSLRWEHPNAEEIHKNLCLDVNRDDSFL